MNRIDTITPRGVARTLRLDELDAVNGGIQDSESVGFADSENRAVICGFNPQPDPPGAPALMLVR